MKKFLQKTLSQAMVILVTLLMAMSVVPQISLEVLATPYSISNNNITQANWTYINNNWRPDSSGTRAVRRVSAWNSLIGSGTIAGFLDLPIPLGTGSLNALPPLGIPYLGRQTSTNALGWPQQWVSWGGGITGNLPSWQPVDVLELVVTSNMQTGILDALAPAVPIGTSLGANRTVIIRSCPDAMVAANRTTPFVIEHRGDFQRHFHIHPNATLILENIILCGGEDLTFFGAIPIGSTGGVEIATPFAGIGRGGRLYMMEDATIRNSAGPEGGGVHMQGTSIIDFIGTSSSSHFTMFPGSTLSNNSARDGGGGVFGDGGSVMRLAGNIINNQAVNLIDDFDVLDTNAINPLGIGGGVLSRDGTVEIRGGRIAGNVANTWGGGVSIEDTDRVRLGAPRTRLRMYGGIIENNSVPSYTDAEGIFNWSPVANIPQDGFGGGILIRNANFEMNGGIIQHNRAVYGAGVYLRGGWSMGSILPNWASVSFLDGRRASMNMWGGYIQNNTALQHARPIPQRAGYGGGIRVDVDAHLYIHGGFVQNNHARRGGGISTGDSTFMYGAFAFFQDPGQVTQYGGTIRNNRAELDGGGVKVSGGRIGFLAVAGSISNYTMYGGRIEGNIAGRDGGGIWVRNNCQLYLGWGASTRPTRPEITGNTAGRNGGGTWNDRDTCLRVDLVNVTNNFAGNDGGGMWMARWQYTSFLHDNAYDLNGRARSGTGLAMRHNVFFGGNVAGAGWFHPPVNAFCGWDDGVGLGFGINPLDVNARRMPLAETVQFGNALPNISVHFEPLAHPNDPDSRITRPHQLNNFDINHRNDNREDDGDEPIDNDPIDRYPPDLYVNKDFRMYGGSTVPAALFVFNAELYSVNGNRNNLPQVPIIIPTIFFFPGGSGNQFDSAAINLAGVHWPRPGIYRFRVTEEQGSSGLHSPPDTIMVYDDSEFFLYVYVGFPRGAQGIFDDPLEILHVYTLPSKSRDITFINYFSEIEIQDPVLKSFEIEKVVTGIMADPNQEFQFTVTFTFPPLHRPNYLLPEIWGYDRSVTDQLDVDTRIRVDEYPYPSIPVTSNTVTHTFYLRHGDVITFLNLPIDTTFVVVETAVDYYIQSGVATTGGVRGGTVSASGLFGMGDLEIDGTILERAYGATTDRLNYVLVTNYHTDIPPMGMIIRSTQFIGFIIIAAGVLGGVFLLKMRSSRRFTKTL